MSWSSFISYSSLSDLSVGEGGIYGRFWSGHTLGIVHITDSSGNFVETVNNITLPSGKILDSLDYKNYVFIKYALTDSSNAELGYQHIYSVNLSTNEILNHFDNVANRNALEVVSYSVGGERLYFSAVRGTSVENQVVDIVTNQSNPLEVNRKMVALYAF